MAAGYFENDKGIVPFDGVTYVDKEEVGQIKIFQGDDGIGGHVQLTGEDAQRFLEEYRAYGQSRDEFTKDVVNALGVIATVIESQGR
jgi:hypothetical protein